MSKFDRFWAKSLGCKQEDLNFKKSKIAVRTEETDYNKDRTEKEIDIFQQNGNRIVSCHREIEGNLKEHEEKLLKADMSQKEIEKTGLKVKELLGPAFLSYTTQQRFKKAESRNCRRLKQADSEKLEKLKRASDKEEIGNSIGDAEIGDSPVFGKFVDEKLIAVSSYEVWNKTIGFPDVFVKEDFRGKGYGKQVVSKSTENILEDDLIPVYRTLQRWSSSVGLAKSLGYMKYATTYLLKLEE